MSKGILIHEQNKSLLGKQTPEKPKNSITFPCCEKPLPKLTGQNTGHRTQQRDACPSGPLAMESHQECLGVPASKHHQNGSVKSSNKAKLDVIKCRVGHWRVHAPWGFHQAMPCNASEMLHFLFLVCSLYLNEKKSFQTLWIQYHLSPPPVTHQGPTVSPSSCKQEFKSSNHQVRQTQPLQHSRDAQIFPGHWKTCMQHERGADTGSNVNICILKTKLPFPRQSWEPRCPQVGGTPPLCHPIFCKV